MFEQRKCPICGKSDLEQYSPNEKYFVFITNSTFYCTNCGCSYKEEDVKDIKRGTKISKKDFYSSLFKAIKDIFQVNELTDEQKKSVIAFYDGKIKSYYKEVLTSQIVLFYELACKVNEEDFFKLLEKISNKNKLI